MSTETYQTKSDSTAIRTLDNDRLADRIAHSGAMRQAKGYLVIGGVVREVKFTVEHSVVALPAASPALTTEG